MPKHVRNFWINVSVDGKKTDVGAGPMATHGGFSAVIYMRERGEVFKAAFIKGESVGGNLVLKIEGQRVPLRVINIKTER